MNRREFVKGGASMAGGLWLLPANSQARLPEHGDHLPMAAHPPMEPTAAGEAEPPAASLMAAAVADGAPRGEAATRAPIPCEFDPYNHVAQMVRRPADFDAYLAGLRADPPELVLGIGGQFVGLVPFDSGWRGAIQGRDEPVLGDGTQQDADPARGYERLPAAQLKERVAALADYTRAVHARGGLKRVMPYIDLGTQILGRHTRPADLPKSAWGFWEFYDHWEEYATAFGLGPKPPDPREWLRRWHADEVQNPAFPDELRGLSFPYSPIAARFGPSYRHAACLNTPGWTRWSAQVARWAARVGYDGVFIDNAQFTNCWNRECRDGYRAWLARTFDAPTVRRYFGVLSDNLLADPSIEAGWTREPASGQWRAAYWTYSPATASPIFPDTDAVGGRYACRIESPAGAAAYFSHIPQAAPAGRKLRLTFHYRTKGAIQLALTIRLDGVDRLATALPAAAAWTPAAVEVETGGAPGGTVEFWPIFSTTGAGAAWLDECWLGEAAKTPRVEFPLEPPFGEPVRAWAAGAYWAAVAEEKVGYLRREGRAVNPKFEVTTNGFHARHADFFLSEAALVPELDAYRRVARGDVGCYPGVYSADGAPVLVSNAFGHKYVHSRRRPDHVGYHLPLLQAPAGHHHNPDSALLTLAEAAAFGDGAGCDAAHLRLNYWAYGESEAAPIRAAARQFWAFVRANTDLYEGYRAHADVGIVFHDLPYVALPAEVPGGEPQPPGRGQYLRLTDLARGLAERGALWDVLTEERCDAAAFAGLKALVYQDVARISAAEAEAARAFLERGGLVLAAGAVGDDDEWFRMRLPGAAPAWPPVGLPPTGAPERARPAAFAAKVGAGLLLYQPTPLTADAVLAAFARHTGRGARALAAGTAGAALRLNAWARQTPKGPRLAVHVVNYGVPLGVGNGGRTPRAGEVQLRVPTPPGMTARSVTLHAPPPQAGVTVGPVAFRQEAPGVVAFTIPQVHIYTVAVIE